MVIGLQPISKIVSFSIHSLVNRTIFKPCPMSLEDEEKQSMQRLIDDAISIAAAMRKTEQGIVKRQLFLS